MSGMKKFFGIGLLALLTTAYLTSSCSRDEFSGSIIDAKKEAFNEVFKDVYGTPDPQHTWGFDGSETRAFTRGSYPNGNMWESEGWNVPPELTAGQKERVYKYFQCHNNLSYTDPGYTNYWIQQVYKGGTDPTNSWSQTPEKYTSANNGLVVGSDHMDHLEAVLSDGTHEHIFNFNNGNCTDWGGRMLMTNSGTHLFGYFNSEGSLGHTDKTGLVSWTDIETWGETNHVGASLADGWNRSFMGFDYEQIIGDDIFAKDDQVWENGKLVSYTVHYLTYGDLPSADYIWNGTTASARPAASEYVLYNGEKIPVLINETNMYCGDNGDIDQNQLITSQSVFKYYKDNGEPYYQNENCLDMTVINTKVAAEYLPVQSSNGTKWVKVHGGADGYFSDWIVTLIEATGGSQETGTFETIPVQEIIDGRVFCEDLGSAQSTDIDYNDVVFDAFTYMTKTYKVPYTLDSDNKRKYDLNNKVLLSTVYEKTDINLLAAGGTIDIQVAQQDVNSLLGIDKSIMANTYVEGASTNTSGYTNFRDNVSPYKFTVNNPAFTNLGSIPIAVKYSGEVRELTAYIGDVPQKFTAPVGTPWAVERKEINSAFTGFRTWVSNRNAEPWYTKYTSNLYHVKFCWNASETIGGSISATTSSDIDTNKGIITVNGKGKKSGEENFITITLDQPLAEGDQIAITGYRNRDDNKVGSLYFKFDNNRIIEDKQVYNNKKYGSKANTFVWTVTSDKVGCRSFQLSRNQTGTNVYITDITIISGLGAQRSSSSSTNTTTNTTTTTTNTQTGTAPNVIGPANPTWSGEVAFTVDAAGAWHNNITIDGGNDFNGMGNGTFIRIYGYGTSNDWQVQLARQQDASPWKWTDMTNEYVQSGNSVNTSTTIEFGPLPADSAQAVIDDGRLIVLGKNFVVKYIKIDNSGVSTGSSTGGGLSYNSSNNGNDYVMTVNKSAFTNVKTGDIIRLYGTRNEQNNFYVSVYGNNSSHNANLAISGWENGSTARNGNLLSTYIDIPVSCELTVSTLKEYGLYINADITPSKIELVAGTRTTPTGVVTFLNGSENAGYYWQKTLNTTLNGDNIDYKNVAAGSILRIYGSQQAGDNESWSVTVNSNGNALPFVGFANAEGITSFNKETNCIELVFNNQTVITAAWGSVQVLAAHFTVTKIELDRR